MTNQERRPRLLGRIRYPAGGLILATWLTSCAYSDSPQFDPGVPLGTVDGKKLKEISGMTASRRLPGVLWVHNDGSKGGLFALSTNGTLLATFKLNTEVTDLEDMAIGPGPVASTSYLYLGDIGDNDGVRTSIRVYRFPEPNLDTVVGAKKANLIEAFETITLSYPERNPNAEALLVDPLSGDLFVISKEKKRARVYVAKKETLRPDQTVPLALLGDLACAQVSAGDISPDGSEMLLRREDYAWRWVRRPGETVADAFSRPPHPAAVIGRPLEPNGESISFSADGSGYFTLSEGQHQPVYFFARKAPRR